MSWTFAPTFPPNLICNREKCGSYSSGLKKMWEIFRSHGSCRKRTHWPQDPAARHYFGNQIFSTEFWNSAIFSALKYCLKIAVCSLKRLDRCMELCWSGLDGVIKRNIYELRCEKRVWAHVAGRNVSTTLRNYISSAQGYFRACWHKWVECWIYAAAHRKNRRRGIHGDLLGPAIPQLRDLRTFVLLPSLWGRFVNAVVRSSIQKIV